MNSSIQRTMKLLATTALYFSIGLTTIRSGPLQVEAFATTTNPGVLSTRAKGTVPPASRRTRRINNRQPWPSLSALNVSSEPTRTTRRNSLPPFHPPLPPPPSLKHTPTTATSQTTLPPSVHAPLSSSPSSSPFSPIQRKIVGIDTTMLEPWESAWLLRIENWYRQALAIKCPFLRRRASDALDVLEMLVRQVCLSKQQRDMIGPPVALRCEGVVCYKERHLPTSVVLARIRADWKPVNHKGYYITGKLSTELYRDDCYFDGPDPDMPVHGLRKYLNAASQLFETKTSTAELIQLWHDPQTDLIHAQWRMKGILRLPWRPALPVVTGTTTYIRDADGLIYRHNETWDMTVAQAFLHTLWPWMAERIWKDSGTTRHGDNDDDEATQTNQQDSSSSSSSFM